MTEAGNQGLQKGNRLTRTTLFNAEGEKLSSKPRLVGGISTRILNFTMGGFPWAMDYYRKMTGNFFNPQQFNLTKENKDYASLSDVERKVYERTILSSMILESILQSNLHDIAPYFSSPDIAAVMATMEYQLVEHCDTYSQIINSAVPESRRESVSESWRSVDQIKQKSALYVEQLGKFQKDQQLWEMYRNLLISATISGTTVPTEFTVIYALARHSKVVGTSNALKFIQRDLFVQSEFLQSLIKALVIENQPLGTPEAKKESVELVRELVKVETDFIHYVSEAMIPGLSEVMITRFSQSLCNRISKTCALDTIFPGITMSPIPWFDTFTEVRK
jgi:ribonucleoside-diphosphate reductase beta chain